MPREIFCGKTDIGLRRSNNEDVFVTSPELGFCLAADGLGGAAAGELASKIFADTASEVFTDATDRSEKEIVYRVKKSFYFANERMLEHVTRNPNHKGMGCTAELLAFSGDGFIIGHVGDSRTYRFRKGQLEQLTQDHTLVQEQVEQGLIRPDNVRDHPLGNIVLRAVGQENELALDLLRGKVLRGDLFLLNSDGLTDMVQDDQIQQILTSDVDIHRKVDALIESAKAAGGKDNITVVLVSIA
jgi:serine/threonine protein phosphatase PrpC